MRARTGALVSWRGSFVAVFVASCGGSTVSQGGIGDRYDASLDGSVTDGAAQHTDIAPEGHIPPTCTPDAGIRRDTRSIDAATTCAGFVPYEVGPVSAVSNDCALRTDGSVTCWYDDWEGSFLQISGFCGVRSDHTVQCRNGTYAGFSIPGSFVQVAGKSESFLCAIESAGTVRCWSVVQDVALELPGPSDRFSDIDALGGQACAIRTDGTLSCWTYEWCMGDGGVDTWCPAPWCTAPECAIPAGTFTDVTLGGYFACAVALTGEISCWATTATSPGRPVPTPPPGKFRRIDAQYGVCAVAVDGHVECFNSNGRLGPVPSTITNARDVTVRSPGDHACAVDGQGRVHCWPGDGWQGSKPFTAIAVGEMGPCALDSDGALHCWGGDSASAYMRGPFDALAVAAIISLFPQPLVCGLTRRGQVSCALGANSSCDFAPPGPSTSATVGSIAASRDAFCILDDCGYVSCSRDVLGCISGQTGQPRFDQPRADRFTQISAGESTFCGLGSTGSVECWDSVASIGAHRDGPYREVGVGGSDFACALRVDGELECWGDKVPPGVSPCRFESIAVGRSLVCGLQSDGQPVCSGLAHTPRGPFVAIASWPRISSVCGLRPTGSIDCWGGVVGAGWIPAGWY